MSTLSPAGDQIVNDLANRHGFSQEAVTHMLIAVANGNGSMAQFNHWEFGGGGQWMGGGMLMIGDMFNGSLKNRVGNLCQDCASALAQHQTGALMGSFQSQSQSGSGDQQHQAAGTGSQYSLFVPDAKSHWWPSDLGQPSASGSQNNARYAYFGSINRLAVATGSDVWVYDTLNHQIGGFSQQQSGDGSITLTSQFGIVPVSQLPVVMRNGQPVSSPPPAPPTVANSSAAESAPLPATVYSSNDSSGDIFDKLDRLGALLEKGILTQAEFDGKKSELLSRL